MSAVKVPSEEKRALFESVPVPKAIATLAIPTIVSQLISLVYNMVDAFFIGRTGNSYMMAAATLALTLTIMNVALSNLFGMGGGSLIARLMGVSEDEEARRVSAFSLYGSILIALSYSLLLLVFMDPILRFLGASQESLGYARQYALLVIVLGSLPSILSLTLAHILRNTGYSLQASTGLSSGAILNMVLDPLFMFVLLPRGYEVFGAALATLIGNIIACGYLLYAFRKASGKAPIGMKLRDAAAVKRTSVRSLLSVGIPSALLTGLFDLANVCVNILAAAHSDFVLAGMGIVLKVQRVPNAVNIGICQGAVPIIAFNYSSGNRERMQKTINTARLWGLLVSACALILFQFFAEPAAHLFMSTSKEQAEGALLTIGYAALFLRIHSLASPMQFLNFHTSFCMQAMGNGKATILHAAVRELVFYIPMLFLFDRLLGEIGIAVAMPVAESCGAAFALLLLRRIISKGRKDTAA